MSQDMHLLQIPPGLMHVLALFLLKEKESALQVRSYLRAKSVYNTAYFTRTRGSRMLVTANSRLTGLAEKGRASDTSVTSVHSEALCYGKRCACMGTCSHVFQFMRA